MDPLEQKTFQCPYCGAENLVEIDSYLDARQKFVQDCEICCNPIVIEVRIRSGEIVDLKILREND